MATYHLENVERLRVAKESDAAYAEELSGSIGDFLDIHYKTAEGAIDREMLPDEGMVQGNYQRRAPVLGAQASTLNVSTYLVSDGAIRGNIVSAVTEAEWGVGRILEATLGGYYGGIGGSEDSSAASTASAITMTSGDAVKWSEGQGLICLVNGKFEARPVADVTGDVITPAFPFSAAPANAAAIYHGHTFWFAEDPNESLQFLLESGDRSDVHWLLGMAVTSMGFELTPKQLAGLTVQFAGAAWAHDDDVGTPVGSGPLGTASLQGASPTLFLDSCLNFTSSAAPTRNDLDAGDIQFALNFAYEPYMATCGVNGVRRMVMKPGRPLVSGSFWLPQDSDDTNTDIATYQALRDARTHQRWTLQVGATLPGTWLFDCPDVVVTGVQRAKSGGLHGFRVEWEAVTPADVTTELLRSPIRIMCF